MSMNGSQSGGSRQQSCSQIPGRPSFRSMAMSSVALVPLLEGGVPGAKCHRHSERSFESLMVALRRYAQNKGGEPSGSMQRRLAASENGDDSEQKQEPSESKGWKEELGELVLVIPNAQLTRPGDWRYDETPLRSHDWSNGCQRMKVFDGRQNRSRMAFDRLVGNTKWAQLNPSRETRAVIGVLNVLDCPDSHALQQAHQELASWADLYSTDETTVLTRIFAFDSFHEECHQNLDLPSIGQDLVAFPPSDPPHLIDMHLNVVINDLAVAIFQSLEAQIMRSDAIARALGRRDTHASHKIGSKASPNPVNIATLVGAESETANANSSNSTKEAPALGRNALKLAMGAAGAAAARAISKTPLNQALLNPNTTHNLHDSDIYHLTTPLDLPIPPLFSKQLAKNFTQREIDALKRRDIGRREKYAADLSLLAGSPIDAYERYAHAAELTKNSHDPLWYAASLEGCAASFVAMADAGGHGVDAYLEKNFALPEEIINAALAATPSSSNDATMMDNERREKKGRTNTTMPLAVFALCDEVLGILSRHPKLSHLYAELLLKLASYTADIEESHLRCRWGEGEECYAGDPTSGEPRRYQRSILNSINLSDLKIAGLNSALDSSIRCRKFTDLLHRAVSAGGLDARTRADVAATCARLCLIGIKATQWGSDPSYTRLRLPRKAAFFTTVAAESMTQCASIAMSLRQQQQQQIYLDDSSRRAASLWLAASNLYSKSPNKSEHEYSENGAEGSTAITPRYAWASLRATTLHALSMQQVDPLVAETAIDLLLVLLSEISPKFYSGVDANLYGQFMEDDIQSAQMTNNSRHSSDLAPDSRHGDDGGEMLGTGGDTGGLQRDNSGPLSPLEQQQREVQLVAEAVESQKMAKANANAARNAMNARGPFFANPSPSSITIAQSKWLDDDPIPNIPLPLVDPASILAGAFGSTMASALSNSSDDASIMDSSHHRRQSGGASTGGAGDTFSDLSPWTASPFTAQLAKTVIFFRCVVPRVRFETCALAQMRCIANLTDLRQSMPTVSRAASSPFMIYPSANGAKASNTGGDKNVPLEVISAKIVKSESHLLLERAKAHGYSAKSAGGSMATFFNPYANKKTEGGGKVPTTLVAEGEERTVVIEFGNKLSVPLEVPSCRLEFDSKGSHRIEAPPLSFVVPAKTKSFMAHFPFSVVSPPNAKDAVDEHEEERPNESQEEQQPPKQTYGDFDLVGLHATCLNRCFSISFESQKSNSDEKGKGSSSGTGGSRVSVTDLPAIEQELPDSASVYQRSIHNRPKQKEQQVKVRMESVPAQPNLVVSFASSQTPLHDAVTVPVHLSDGEIYTIPPFRLENDFGTCGRGKMERLQILGVGLPGLPDEVLFDTDELAAAREGEEDILTDSEDEQEEDFEEMMECDGLPPLKMKALTEGLSLRSINDKSRRSSVRVLGGSTVTFQIAATHDMGNQLANGGNVRIRFRYRGPSPNPATEIWRKREVGLRIVRVKGPRISSLTFRSDLSWGSAYSELCKSLAEQRLRLEAVPKWETSRLKRRIDSATSGTAAASMDGYSLGGTSNVDGSTVGTTGDSILSRVGMDQGVHVSGNEVVVLMAVANETNSTVVLSNRKGLVGGFEGSPMPTVRVTSGVSVKIPVVIQRIDRLDNNAEVVDIAMELISRTALHWESEPSEGEIAANKKVRQGRVRIPTRCLREIIDEHKSFSSRICRPPVSVQVSIGREESHSELLVSPGSFVEAVANVNIQDWVPAHVLSQCSITIEFCCARKDSGSKELSLEEKNSTAYVWCGQLRRTVVAEDDDMDHRARVTFFQCGVFVVSACAKISGGEGLAEETWWAPHAEIVKVENENK